jgi:hypothetical protein
MDLSTRQIERYLAHHRLSMSHCCAEAATNKAEETKNKVVTVFTQLWE